MIPNTTNRSNQWQSNMESLHGDAFRVVNAINITIGQELFCQAMSGCMPDFTQESSVNAWNEAIAHSYAYNVWIDGLPSVIRTEDEYVKNVLW
jgi:hypothetical protein